MHPAVVSGSQWVTMSAAAAAAAPLHRAWARVRLAENLDISHIRRRVEAPHCGAGFSNSAQCNKIHPSVRSRSQWITLSAAAMPPYGVSATVWPAGNRGVPHIRRRVEAPQRQVGFSSSVRCNKIHPSATAGSQGVSTSAPAAADVASSHAWARVRLADKRDVPHVRGLIHKMAEFYHLDNIFSATDASLCATLFPEADPLPPFKSVTVFILEVSPGPDLPSDAGEQEPFFTPVTRRIDLASPIVETESEEFASPRGGGRVVAGFIIFFPNFSTFLGKPGFYVEDLYVREPYRRRGFAGEMLLSAVAGQAARMGMGRVEWSIVVWNTNSIKFYEGMGAEVLKDWRICRLGGDKLLAYGKAQVGNVTGSN